MFAVQAFVNLHSGEYAVYVPWDSKSSLAPNLPADITDVLERIDSYCQCMHGAAGAVAGWVMIACLSCDDWMTPDE